MGVLLLLASVVPLVAAPAAMAAGGDFTTVDFAAAESTSYEHSVGGGAYDDATKNVDVVEQLQGGDYVCGDIITFFTRLKLDSGPDDQVVRLTYTFGLDSGGQSGVGYTEVTGVSINRSPIVDLLEADTVEDGLVELDADSTATLISDTIDPGDVQFQGGQNSNRTAVVDVDGLDVGETIIVRVDARLDCDPNAAKPSGNVDARLASAEVISDPFSPEAGDPLAGGQQTITLLRAGDVVVSNPAILVTKTASPTSLDEPGGAVTFSVDVDNTGDVELSLNSLVDDIHGDLNGQGDCSVPQTIAVAGTYSCSFTAQVTGNAGYSETDTVTGTATDPDQTEVSDSDTATVTINDVLPTLTVSKTANPTTVQEPGGDVTFTVVVTNTSAEDVTLDSLVDDTFDDLNGQGDCVTGGTIAANGGQYSCSFTTAVNGNVGDTHTNVVTAEVSDNDGNSASANDDADVVFDDVLPEITVEKTATPSSVDEPGGPVTFSVTVTNDSIEDVTLTFLVDDIFGDLNGQGDCATGGTITANGGTYSCSFSGNVAGNAGDVHTNTVTATAQDDEGNDDSDSDSATVTVTGVGSSIAVTKTANPTVVDEPGDTVTYTVEIQNTSSVDDVTIDSITDNRFDQATVLSGDCADLIGDVLAPSDSVSCTFDGAVTGQAGDEHVNTVTVDGTDDDGDPVTDSDDATVAVRGLGSSILVTKDADPTSVQEPGGTVTFSVTVQNTSEVDTVFITSLVDDTFGDLDGQGTCSLGEGSIELDPGETYSCEFDGSVQGSGGTTHTNIVTASGFDDDEDPVSDDDDAVVQITSTPPPPPPPSTTTTTTQPQSASVGDLVWNDINGNGIQDPGEPGIPGVTVELIDEDGVVVATTTTDANGNYLFEDVEPGTYQVRWELPDLGVPGDEVFTLYKQGDDFFDSDAATDGITDPFEVGAGVNIVTIDAGIAVVEVAGTTISAETLPFTGGDFQNTALAAALALAGGLLLILSVRKEEDEAAADTGTSFGSWNSH